VCSNSKTKRGVPKQKPMSICEPLIAIYFIFERKTRPACQCFWLEANTIFPSGLDLDAQIKGTPLVWCTEHMANIL